MGGFPDVLATSATASPIRRNSAIADPVKSLNECIVDQYALPTIPSLMTSSNGTRDNCHSQEPCLLTEPYRRNCHTYRDPSKDA